MKNAFIFCLTLLLTSMLMDAMYVERIANKITLKAYSNARILLYFLMFSVLIYVTASGEEYSTKALKQNYGVEVQFEDSSILKTSDQVISDSSNYYIGKTINFVFIYNEKSQTTNIYPMEKVIAIRFPKKPYVFKLL